MIKLPYSLMMTWRTIRLGAINVRAHKMRSILTVLGIVFGVCSVISMLSIGEGASREVQDQIKRLGSLNIIIESTKPPQNQADEQSNNMVMDYGLKYADAERLHATLPTIKISVPIKARTEDLRYSSHKVTTELVATVPWFLDNTTLKILPGGRFFTSLDMERFSNVCVLGSKEARELFLYEDPLGKSIQVGSDVYRVIGIIDDSDRASAPAAGTSATEGEELASQTANCFVPLTTLRSREGDFIHRRQQGQLTFERIELSEVILNIRDISDVLPTAKIVEKTLAAYHPRSDYRLVVPLRMMEEARKTKRIFTIVLSSIAAISLLVGGIGIMNIMLATVSERTREIGVRRALGARRRDILSQILVETLLLSAGGGLLGMALGAVIPMVVTRLTKMPTFLTPMAFILSFSVSVAIGLIFGLYPARRAATMDPIEALRYE
ncbi:MAG: ABC transporter permease [bacterium]|nr:ABC transporter permease [bacterium]